MPMQTLDETPVRVRDAVRLSHLAIAIVVAVVTVIGTLSGLALPLAAWKGSVDVQLTTLHDQLEKMDRKLDRMAEPEEAKRR